MNTFAVIFLCVQACLVQNVFSQCLGRPGIAPTAAMAPYGNGIAAPGYGMFLDALGGIGPYGYGPEIAGIDAIAQYGGVGEGNVAVAGELPVAGTTAVAGQVPIMGAVRFGGDVAAAGAVTITGQCACSPAIPLEYLY